MTSSICTPYPHRSRPVGDSYETVGDAYMTSRRRLKQGSIHPGYEPPEPVSKSKSIPWMKIFIYLSMITTVILWLSYSSGMPWETLQEIEETATSKYEQSGMSGKELKALQKKVDDMYKDDTTVAALKKEIESLKQQLQKPDVENSQDLFKLQKSVEELSQKFNKPEISARVEKYLDWAVESTGTDIRLLKGVADIDRYSYDTWYDKLLNFCLDKVFPHSTAYQPIEVLLRTPKEKVNPAECYALTRDGGLLEVILPSDIKVYTVVLQYLAPSVRKLDTNTAPKSASVYLHNQDSDVVGSKQKQFEWERDIEEFQFGGIEARTVQIELSGPVDQVAEYTCLYRIRIYGNII